MKIAELVEARMKTVESLEKRLSAKPSAQLAEKLGKETLAAQAESIERRIARLDQQRVATLERYDAALKTEHAALDEVRKLTAHLPLDTVGMRGEKAKPAVAAAAAAPAKATAARPAASNKPATRAKSARTRPTVKR